MWLCSTTGFPHHHLVNECGSPLGCVWYQEAPAFVSHSAIGNTNEFILCVFFIQIHEVESRGCFLDLSYVWLVIISLPSSSVFSSHEPRMEKKQANWLGNSLFSLRVWIFISFNYLIWQPSQKLLFFLFGKFIYYSIDIIRNTWEGCKLRIGNYCLF